MRRAFPSGSVEASGGIRPLDPACDDDIEANGIGPVDETALGTRRSQQKIRAE
jgi:hypothetical protein